MPASDRVYRTEGIVLRRHDLGETDRILTLYTRDHGKLKVVAKGIRKPSSRKAGHLELFMRSDLLIARGRSLDIVTQAELIDAYPRLRTDLVRATYASHFIELLDAFTEEGDASLPLYRLLADGLGWLGETADLQRTARYYELRLLDLAGYRPELFDCAVCTEPVKPEDQFFSASDGGVVCRKCGQARPYARRLSLRTLKVLRYLQTRTFPVVERVALSAAAHKESERLLYETLTYYLERRLRSAAFLNRLRREAAAQPAPDDPETDLPD